MKKRLFNLSQNILLFKDKDGIYIYDTNTLKEKVLYNADKNEIFLDENPIFDGNILIFGVTGNLIRKENTQNYIKTYYSLDINTKKSKLVKKINYTINSNTKILKTTILTYDNDNKQQILSETSTQWKSTYLSKKNIIFNNDKPRFYSIDKVGNKSVYTVKGNLYYTIDNKINLLVKYDDKFDAKFGSGYFQPKFSPNANYIFVRFLPNWFRGKPSLKKIDLDTKKITHIKYGQFANLSFSDDGNFILFSENSKFTKEDTLLSDIYILNLKNLKRTKIAKATNAYWLK